jgi:hypothetical protein
LNDNKENLRRQNGSGSIVLYADGTYKLVDTNWVLCKVGIVSVEESETEQLPVHSFRPLVAALTPTEAQPAYEAALSGLIKAGKYTSTIIITSNIYKINLLKTIMSSFSVS